jgi:RNA polymerase sigma factor (TIGR02999 family)
VGPAGSQDITRLLKAWGRGDKAALDGLAPLVYGELRQIAHRYMRKEDAANSLQTTALVNEAYLKLVDAQGVEWQDRAHFFAVSAQMMRRILVDAARARGAEKRGGGWGKLDLNESIDGLVDRSAELVALDDALEALAAIDSRKARVVEMRFFGGMSVAETAAVLKISEQSVLRDWKLARAWLMREMKK